MSGETIDFKVTVDARQAQGVVANLRSEILGMRAAIAEGKGIDHLGEQAKQLQSKMGPAAAAISGVSAALGAQAGAAGQALNAVGQLTAAFGAGGPFGVAIAAAGAGVALLTKHWENEVKAQDAALAKAHAVTDAITAQTRAIRDQIAAMAPEGIRRRIADEAETARLKSEIAKREEAITTAAREGAAFRIPALKTEIGLLETQVRERDKLRGVEQVNQAVEVSRARAAARAALTGEVLAIGHDREVELARRAGEAEGKAYVKAREDFRARALAAGEAAAASSSRMGAGFFGGISDAMMMGDPNKSASTAQGGLQSVLDASAERARLEQVKQLEWAQNVKMRLFDAEVEANQAKYDKMKAQDEAYWSDLRAVGEGAYGTLINVADQYFSGLASGATMSAEAVTSAILGGIGDQLVGLGVKQSFEGAGRVIGSFGVDTGGWGLLATGSAAIAAGVGMGAAAAAVSPPGVSAAASPSAGARDPGASPRSGGATGSGGPLVVNVAYGVAGPLPEDTARAIAQAVRTGGRR